MHVIGALDTLIVLVILRGNEIVSSTHIYEEKIYTLVHLLNQIMVGIIYENSKEYKCTFDSLRVNNKHTILYQIHTNPTQYIHPYHRKWWNPPGVVVKMAMSYFYWVLALSWSKVRGVSTLLHSLQTLMIWLLPSLAFGVAVSTYESSHRIFKVPMIMPKGELLRLVDPSPTLFGLARNGGTQKAKVLASKVQILCIFVLALKVSNCKFLVTRCWP